MTALFGYEGKKVLVVGCATGMGAATAALVEELGGEVIGADYRAPRADLAQFIECDLRDPSQVDSLVASLTGPIDALFYCAGLPTGRPPQDVMKVNFAAARAVTEGVLALIPRGGAVAIIASTGGLNFARHMEPISRLLDTETFDAAAAWSQDEAETVADGYVLSKEAITVYMMRRAITAAVEGVRVNCVSPGPTDTPMMADFEAASSRELLLSYTGPMQRYATAAEIASALAFVNSSAASYITGLNLLIDGGFLAGVMTGAIDPTAPSRDRSPRR